MNWKNIYRKDLIRNYRALKILHDKNHIPFKLVLPKKLETEKEIFDFSKKINSHIAFPEIYMFSSES